MGIQLLTKAPISNSTSSLSTKETGIAQLSFLIKLFFNARVHRATGGYVFTGVCLFRYGGYSISIRQYPQSLIIGPFLAGYPSNWSQVLSRRYPRTGYPQARQGYPLARTGIPPGRTGVLPYPGLGIHPLPCGRLHCGRHASCDFPVIDCNQYPCSWRK